MTKATHNGTCQACGRQHAVNTKTGKVAKHGYTKQHGWFSGTCAGSDRAPLEVSKDYAIKTVHQVATQAAEIEKRCADASTIEEVETHVRNQKLSQRRGYSVFDYVMMNREAWVSHFLSARNHVTEESAIEYHWPEMQKGEARLGRRKAAMMREFIKDLRNLIDARYGQPLIEREVEKPLTRERFSKYREAAARVEELKAQGIDARSRRDPNFGGGFNVTYR